VSDKQVATDVLTDMLGLARVNITGIQRGTVPAGVFEAAAARVGIAYRNRAATTETIIRRAGLSWHPHYDSRETDSQGGGNVTVPGLRALAQALVILGVDDTPEESEVWIERERWVPGRGQFRMLDPERRHKVEMAAQDWLMWVYDQDGWDVEDTHLVAPYDAIARRSDQVLFLEAKGTTTLGESVIVTRAEVAWAREHPGQCILGVWSDMLFDDDGKINPDVGRRNIVDPWCPEDEDLDPISFDYRVAWPEN
jgi:hypothetical protein